MPESLTLTFGAQRQQVAVGKVAWLAQDKPLPLDSGQQISRFPLAYQTYGRLNAAKDNAILICHGLTGDQYLANDNPVTGKPGWWSGMVGAGKPINSDDYFIISCNVLGGCMGSYGPRSTGEDGASLGLDFPVITIFDMVRAQALLLERLGVDKLHAVIGGSMGGMQAMAFAHLYPQRVAKIVAIATGLRMSPQNIAFNEIGRRAIMADSDWQGGDYVQKGSYPAKGLAVARMTAHVTYLSEAGLQHKFGRNLQRKEGIDYHFEPDFQIESYLQHQGNSFVKRFDPNSYLYITRAMDYFDLTATGSNPFTRCKQSEFLLLSFSTDWLFPTEKMREIVRYLHAAGAPVSFTEIETDKGHDGFLLPNRGYEQAIRGFLA